jgi:hypothetical protein
MTACVDYQATWRFVRRRHESGPAGEWTALDQAIRDPCPCSRSWRPGAERQRGGRRDAPTRGAGSRRRIVGTMRRWGAAVALVCSGFVVGCSDDGDPSDGAGEAQPGSATDLAERLGCESTERETSGRIGAAEVVSCVVDGEWPAHIYAGSTGPQRAAGLRLLGTRYAPDLPPGGGRCPDGSLVDPVVVAGETWIVVIADEAGAQRAIDRVGGEIQAAPTSGPIVSYASPDGDFCRR